MSTQVEAPDDLSQPYMAHHDSSQAEAAYQQEVARLSSGGAKPAGEASPAEPPKPSWPVRAAKDVAYGVGVEPPRALWVGFRGGVQSSLDGATDLGTWLEKKGVPGLKYDFTGKGPVLSVASGEDLQNLPRPFEGKVLPGDIAPPQTVTGTILKNTAQFLTSVALAGRQMRALSLPTEAAGLAGRAISSIKGFAAMFEGFEGASGRLSDLIQSVPALKNPVSDFLASKPDDNEAVGRLKNAVEGAGLAQAADGIVHGIRMLRGANAAKAVADSAPPAAEPQAPAPVPENPLGDPNAPARSPIARVHTDQSATRLTEAQARTAGVTPDELLQTGQAPRAGDVDVNWSRVGSPTDLDRTQSELVRRFADDVNQARRGVQTWEDTRLGADATNAWQVLMERRSGEALNNEETLAARSLWGQSTGKLIDMARAVKADPTPENLNAYRRIFAIQNAVQQQAMGARAESGRAFGAWNIPLENQGDFRIRAVMDGLKDDPQANADMKDWLDITVEHAQRVAALAQAGDMQHLNAFSEKSLYAKTRDGLLEAWTNGLLTAPITHVKVAISNAATIALRIGERAVAARISHVLGDEGGVQFGEASAQIAGLVGGIKDSLRYVGRAANAMLTESDAPGAEVRKPLPELGTDPFSNAIKAFRTGQYSEGSTAETSDFHGAISSESLGMSSSGWLGEGVDLLGQVVRGPGRSLTAEHDFFRSIGMRMETNALATRQAMQELQAGRITQDAVPQRVQQLIETQPPSLRLGATTGMTYQTFTDAPGKFAQKIGDLRQEFPLLKLVLPFYKIPARMLSFGLERTPLAPLMSDFRANMAAGGARQALASAQMGLGVMSTMAMVDAVLSSQATGAGPIQKGTRQIMENEGWQPYSIKVGGRWVQYNRLETVGSGLAMAADAVEAMHNLYQGVNVDDDPDVSNLAFATAMALAQDVTSKSYLQGLSHLFETMASPRTQGSRALESLGGSTVPAGVAAVTNVTDPYKRAVYSMIDAIKARTPGASESLPPLRNVWGEPVKRGSDLGGAYDLFSPFATKESANEPVDKEILRLGMNLSLPSSRVNFEGVPVDLHKDPAMYSRYLQLAGNELRNAGLGDLGAKDALNAIVSGEHPMSAVYQMLPDTASPSQGGKAAMIQDIVNSYRGQARDQLLEEFPKLRAQVDDKREALMALRAPQ